MKLGRPTSRKIDLSDWHSDDLDKGIQGLADQTKQLVIESAREIISYLLVEDSICYFTTPEDGEPRLHLCVGTTPSDPEWTVDLKEILELSDIEGGDAARLANYFNNICEWLRERASPSPARP